MASQVGESSHLRDPTYAPTTDVSDSTPYAHSSTRSSCNDEDGISKMIHDFVSCMHLYGQNPHIIALESGCTRFGTFSEGLGHEKDTRLSSPFFWGGGS